MWEGHDLRNVSNKNFHFLLMTVEIFVWDIPRLVTDEIFCWKTGICRDKDIRNKILLLKSRRTNPHPSQSLANKGSCFIPYGGRWVKTFWSLCRYRKDWGLMGKTFWSWFIWKRFSFGPSNRVYVHSTNANSLWKRLNWFGMKWSY